jgi:GH24 family phage-related lysozyme (muramidase)
VILGESNPEFVALAEAIKGWEGCVDHFYLDTKGLVTIAIGHMVRSLDAALALDGFVVGSRTASKSEIATDFSVVQYAKPAMSATYYAPKCVTRMTPDAILRLFGNDTDTSQKELILAVPGFTDMPEPVQAAVIDMHFTMGISRLRTKFPKFMGHMLARNYAGMLAECKRTEDSENAKRRNVWTEAQIRKAVA